MKKRQKNKLILNGFMVIISVFLSVNIIVIASGGEEMEGSQLEQFEKKLSVQKSIGESGLFNDFDEMEYALFLETNVGYGVTLNYYKYGIFGDFTKDEQEGEDTYFKLCEKVLGVRLAIDTHEEWAENEQIHIQNLSPDLQWVIARSYSSQTIYGLYKDEVIFNEKSIAEAEGALAESENIFTLKKINSENYDFVTDEFIKREKELVNKVWGYSNIWLIKCVTSMDEYGTLLAISEPDNRSIGIYDTENWSMIHHITIDGMDVDYPIEVSQINGDEEEGWMVFSNGDATYRMTYPDGELQKIGEFMYDTTYSPDGKYRAYCMGNIVLNDLWMSLPDEKFDKINNLYIKWDKIAPGWYVEELETGNKTYIPIETWEQDDRPLYGGRCVWIQKDKLLQLLNS